MPLSEYEQRVLEQMERQLTTDDPRLANTLRQRSSRRPVTRYLLAVVGAVVGLLLLVFGVAGSQPLLGVLGFVVMFAAVAFAFANPHRHESDNPQAPARTVSTPAARGRTPRRGLMSRFEDRWDRRHGDSDR